MKLGKMLAVFAALVVTGCSTPEPSEPVKPPMSTTKPVKSELPRLDVAAEASWTSREVFDTELRDGTALVIGHKSFQVIDTATGDVRWAVDADTDLGGGGLWDSAIGTPHLVGDGEDLGVVTAYYRPGETANGLARFSVDGRVVWRTTTSTGAHLRAADDRVVLVSAVEKGVPVDPSDVRMVALDTRTGDELWERTGTWPIAVAGDAVLGTDALAEDGSVLSVNVDAVAAAFDVATGEPRWDLRTRYRGSEIVFATGDVALVHATETEAADAELVLVSVESGEPVTDLGDSEAAHCATDRDTTIACAINGNSVQVFRLDDQSVTRVTTDDLLEAVGEDRIFLGAPDDSHYTVDLAGRKVDEQLPGEPIIVTDDHLVVGGDSESEELAGYRIG